MSKQNKNTIYGDIEAYEVCVPIFGQYFYVLFGKENWDKLCIAEPELKDYIGEDSFGLVAMNTDTNRLYLYFAEIEDNERGTLPHELVHLAHRLCETRGIKQKDEELIAHLVGYLYTVVKPLMK